MSLLSKYVGLADTITKKLGLQVTATLLSYSGDGGSGDPVESTKSVSVIVDYKERRVRGFNGELVVSHAAVTFLTPVVVRERDRIVLPNGSGGPFVGVGGPADTSGQLLTEAYL